MSPDLARLWAWLAFFGGALGRGGENVSLNAATGNLLINRRDEFLVGQGLDIGISRTYNSLGALDDNGDDWRQSTDRRLIDITGTENTTGSTVTRVSADGSLITYTYQTIDGETAYWTTDGAGAHDKLEYNDTALEWTWTNGSTQITETYAEVVTDKWRIIHQQASDGNTVTFSYASGTEVALIDWIDYLVKTMT